jgi:hypothetical protein
MADPLSILFTPTPGRRVAIGAITLDATVQETHEYSSNVTTHPIEDGGFVTDHVYENPRTVHIEGEITNSPVVFLNFLGGLSDRRIEAYDQLVELYQKRDVITLVTGLKVFNDMVIESLNFPRDPQTGMRLKFSADFKETRKVASEIVGVAERKAKDGYKDKISSNKNIGRQETTAATDSQAAKAQQKSLLLDIFQ